MAQFRPRNPFGKVLPVFVGGSGLTGLAEWG